MQLFSKTEAPRRKPIKRMHVCDAGSADSPDDYTGKMQWHHVHLKCDHCGYDDGWKKYQATISELKRGLPCPKCNEVPA